MSPPALFMWKPTSSPGLIFHVRNETTDGRAKNKGLVSIAEEVVRMHQTIHVFHCKIAHNKNTSRSH